MMLNMDNQRPGDLWKIGGKVFEVIDAADGLSVRNTETGETLVLRVELFYPRQSEHVLTTMPNTC